MGQWLGLGTGATSHMNYHESKKIIMTKDGVIHDNITESLHFTTTSSLKEFLAGNYIDEKKTEYLTKNDYLKERFLMGLRTQEGISFTKEEWLDVLSNT